MQYYIYVLVYPAPVEASAGAGICVKKSAQLLFVGPDSYLCIKQAALGNL